MGAARWASLMKPALLAAGTFTLALVLMPPLGVLGQQLFAAHMLQHLLLIVVAAPILVLSGTLERRFENAGRWIRRNPAVAWTAFTGIFLLWHWPAAFRWAARSPASTLLEFASIFLSAYAFWSTALAQHSATGLDRGGAAVFVVTAALVTDLPGVVMVFAPLPICTMPAENAARFGLSPLQDQELAGLLMWVAANLVFFAIATWLAATWLCERDPHGQLPSPACRGDGP